MSKAHQLVATDNKINDLGLQNLNKERHFSRSKQRDEGILDFV